MTPESILSGALADELRAWLEFTTKTGQRLPCRPFRVVVEEVLAALASPAPQATPTMDDALAAGDGTLHGAIDYWQSRALAAEAKATGALSEQAKQLVAECTSYVNDLANWREDDSESRHEAAWQSAIMTIGQLAALSSAKREAEPVAWRPGVKCQPLQNFNAGKPKQQDIDYWKSIGVEIEFAYAAAPLARSPLTEEQLFRLIEQSGAPYRKPMYQTNKYTGDEETVYVMTTEFSEFKFARQIEAAHGIVAPTLQPSEDKK